MAHQASPNAGEPDWYIVYCHLEPYIFENARKLRDAIERMDEAGKTVPEGYRERLVELETTTAALPEFRALATQLHVRASKV